MVRTTRKRLQIFALLISAVSPPAASIRVQAEPAADFPLWAYRPDLPDSPIMSDARQHADGSSLDLTQAQIENPYFVPDWYPGTHTPMPEVVASGRAPIIEACGLCHLPTGAGHPESSELAGLSVAFLQGQMKDFRDGKRKSPITGHMVAYAKAISDADTLAAANYYARQKRYKWTTIIEADLAPKTIIGAHGQSFVVAGGGVEPRRDPILEISADPELAKLRASRKGFIAYVPVGSVAKGKTLVSARADGLVCTLCHGADLKGSGDVPSLAGRSPLYVFRSLNDIKLGVRTGDDAASMQAVVGSLSQEDMVAIAAYLASLEP